MEYEVVPEGLGHCLGHLGLGNIHLGIVGEVVHIYQDILLLTLPWHQAQVVDVHQLQGSRLYSLLLLHLEDDALVAPLNVFLCLGSHLKPNEMVMHQIKHAFET